MSANQEWTDRGDGTLVVADPDPRRDVLRPYGVTDDGRVRVERLVEYERRSSVDSRHAATTATLSAYGLLVNESATAGADAYLDWEGVEVDL